MNDGDWAFAIAIEHSREPWTDDGERLPFFRVFRGKATGDLYVKLWRFLLTVMVLKGAEK